jgi:hypothetical protein
MTSAAGPNTAEKHILPKSGLLDCRRLTRSCPRHMATMGVHVSTASRSRRSDTSADNGERRTRPADGRQSSSPIFSFAFASARRRIRCAPTGL